MPPESHNPGGGLPISSESTSARSGDAQAVWVRAAVERYEGPLVLYARHVLGGDAERARDVVQDTFLRLIGQDRAKVGPHLTEWLYTVCRNLAIDVRRKEQRMQRLSDADADSAASGAPDPGAHSEQDDAMTLVLRGLKQLPRNQQECIRLKFQGGLSYKQISAVTNLTVTNVGFLIHTGLKTLRMRLANDNEATTKKELKTTTTTTTAIPRRPKAPAGRNDER
jgi:RNA polymerase sigma-70 factor (ECF subfamily)